MNTSKLIKVLTGPKYLVEFYPMASPNKYLQVITTIEKKYDAEKIGRLLVEKKFASCVQLIGPIMSTHRWKDKVVESEKWICLIKTKMDHYDEIEEVEVIKGLHQYGIPEIIAVPIINGSVGYLSWIDEETS